MVHNCPFCEAKVEADFKFCGVCGKLLKKTCQRCNIKFEPTFNFCGQCGNALEKSSFDPNFRSHTKKTQDLTDKSGIKVKVSILHGLDMNTIKQEQGGGSRRIYLNQTDDFNGVKKKVTELYFPRNSYTCLGRVREYQINMLDFKKQLLNYKNFKNLSSYVDTHGLTPQVKPIFFLHLFRNENHLNTGSLVPIASTEKNPKADHLVKKTIKKEDLKETSNQSSTGALSCSKNLGNEKKLVESSSSSSSESENEVDKNNLSTQNVGYKSLRQINKFLNPSENNLAKRRIHKRDSSSSSVSSSSSTASFKKAKKLDKKLNRRIQSLKKETDPDHNTKPLLPTPNKTPSSKANISDQFKNNHNSASNKNLVILLKEKTSHECEEIVIDDGDQQKCDHYNNVKNSASYSHNRYYNSKYHSYSSNKDNYNYSTNYNQNRYSYRNNSAYRGYNNNHNYYYKNNQYSISKYGNYDNYNEDKSNPYS